ncbi:isoaspartyl peptidase/L-asparaginase family protein [Psychroflexus aestuariivivens]|uniref:isoaspartyl peptidase/L-asparaginase family protein n=1 Tax=Psychroflexus aestuariivivens TaxID=1795040 RepID=UPI000FDAC155|nr:isoaspartyl peptidase/L-asparaginase [Psychroflexus aestuariivivens]
MKKIILLISLCLLAACHDSPKISKGKPKVKSAKYGIVIHGGAGYITKSGLSDSLQEAYHQKLEEAIKRGHLVLENGGTAMEAVQKSINILENSPLFNAGKGGVLNANGEVEMDASIMNGENKNAGAVAGVQRIKNPINLARDIMINSPHVMLSGTGAEAFAIDQGYDLLDKSYFITAKSQRALEAVQKRQSSKISKVDATFIQNRKFGTVGCVALDQDGNLAAGTSTGGMTNKKWGRIGDSPVIGAGTYANNETCAISATGHGEYFIRNVVAYDISAMMAYKGISLKQAAQQVIQKKLAALGGEGGIIGIDQKGNMVAEFNTPGMFRAQMNSKSEIKIEMFGKGVD